jgi:hypothetical protein
MIEDFRLGREGGVLEEEPLQDAPPATVVLDEDSVEEVELARLRELEETELQVLIEESERAGERACCRFCGSRGAQGEEDDPR